VIEVIAAFAQPELLHTDDKRVGLQSISRLRKNPLASTVIA
jgi:hypothetical protein